MENDLESMVEIESEQLASAEALYLIADYISRHAPGGDKVSRSLNALLPALHKLKEYARADLDQALAESIAELSADPAAAWQDAEADYDHISAISDESELPNGIVLNTPEPVSQVIEEAAAVEAVAEDDPDPAPDDTVPDEPIPAAETDETTVGGDQDASDEPGEEHEEHSE